MATLLHRAELLRKKATFLNKAKFLRKNSKYLSLSACKQKFIVHRGTFVPDLFTSFFEFEY